MQEYVSTGRYMEISALLLDDEGIMQDKYKCFHWKGKLYRIIGTLSGDDGLFYACKEYTKTK